MPGLRSVLMSDNPGVVLREMFRDGSLKELEPSLVALRMDIPAGYHHKDNFEHSVRVLENAISHESAPDLILRTAALFHDVGKPDTRQFVGKGEVTFDGHEVVGARMVSRILPGHGYSRDEVKQISKLVRLHMRSFGFAEKQWTDSAVRRLIVDAGEQLNRLIVLFYADVTSGVPKKKERIHRGIASLEARISQVKAQDARTALRPALNGNEVMELFNLAPGKQVGQIMKFLNTDEGIRLSREEALLVIRDKFTV